MSVSTIISASEYARHLDIHGQTVPCDGCGTDLTHYLGIPVRIAYSDRSTALLIMDVMTCADCEPAYIASADEPDDFDLFAV